MTTTCYRFVCSPVFGQTRRLDRTKPMLASQTIPLPHKIKPMCTLHFHLIPNFLCSYCLYQIYNLLQSSCKRIASMAWKISNNLCVIWMPKCRFKRYAVWLLRSLEAWTLANLVFGGCWYNPKVLLRESRFWSIAPLWLENKCASHFDSRPI